MSREPTQEERIAKLEYEVSTLRNQLALTREKLNDTHQRLSALSASMTYGTYRAYK